MSKRSEEAAMKVYPEDRWFANPADWGIVKNPRQKDYNAEKRAAFILGYEQAEKDTIERAVDWLKDYVKYFEIYDEKGVEEFRKAMEDEE